jgi:hypothetical protein
MRGDVRPLRRYGEQIWPCGLNPNVTEIAMLMPILSVKTPATAAQAAIVVEAVTPREQTVAVPVPGRISGNQSEAVLKILETLNRHLLGSEPLPKDALIRLLDTLSKILKFPPLPQETLRDFTKRLAVFLETLPPAARLALEKQLGQRNLAVTIKVLAEVLKMPLIIDTPRLPDRPFVPPTPLRASTSQPDGKPPQTAATQQGQASVPGRQAPMPATQTIMASPAVIMDPGLLQAALKKAFGDDDTAPAIIAFEESLNEEGPTTAQRAEQPARAQAARGNELTAASGRQQPPARANSETIPLLRAAAAFLAADPEALSLIATIAAGDMDDGMKIELAEQLGLDLSEPMGASGQQEHPTVTNTREPETLASKSRGTTALEATFGDDLHASGTDAEANSALPAEPAAHPDTSISSAKPPIARDLNEVDGFKGHDLGEWELEAAQDSQTSTGTDDFPAPMTEADMDGPEKSLARTLKVLVEASLPLPGGTTDGAETLFAKLAGETADMGAEILFAQLEAADNAEMLPDTSLITGDIGDPREMPGLEPEAWSAMLEGPEEKPAYRQTLMHSATAEENAREALTPRLPEAGIVRDAIPFAMIPYLPAKTQDKPMLEIEDEEQRASGDDEEEGQHQESHEQQEDRDDSDTAAAPAAEDRESDTGDAYDFYRRMGGLG